MNFRYITFTICCMALFSTGAMAQEILARAEANPSVVMVGESADYSIQFLNTRNLPNLTTPRVDGLAFSGNPSISEMSRIFNGRITIESTLSWSFRPTRTGSFTIPGRVIEVDGQEVAIPAVEVEAVPQSEEAQSRAFIKLQLPASPYYVGQALPARLALYIRRDLSVSNIEFPDLTNDYFVHSEFSNNPVRLAVQVEGRPYEVLAWDILITPIKTGSTELKFSQNIVVQIPVSDGRFPSIFSMRQARTEPYTLASEGLEMEILPPPEEGQPDSFRDAIGQFEVSMELSSNQLTVGEPVTVTLRLSGKGNFDRISPPELPEWENWRFYPPKVSFEASDQRGYEGQKSFEYILIPQSTGISELPELTYSTFNPASGDYETTLLEARPLTVNPSLTPIDPDISMPGFGQESKPQVRIPESILSLKPNAGTLITGSVHYWKNAGFWIANGFVALALLVLAWWQKRRMRLRTDNRLARRHEGSRKVRKVLQQAAQAAQNGNADSFFQAARFCIAECTCHLAQSAPEARTMVTSDCLQILEEARASEDTRARATAILNAADAHQFASIVPESGQLKSLQEDLSSLISQLNRLQK